MNDFTRSKDALLPEGKRKLYQHLIEQMTPPRTNTDRIMLTIYRQLIGHTPDGQTY